MSIKPNQTLVFSIIFLFFSIFFVYTRIYNITLRSAIQTWDVFISHYITEKNRSFTSTFFQNANNLHVFNTLNYNYFKRILEEDISLNSFDLAGISIYDVNENFIWSHKLPSQVQTYHISDAEIFSFIKEDLMKNNVTIREFRSGKSNYKIICAPLTNTFHAHYASLIYIFNIDKYYQRTFGQNEVAFLGILLFFVCFGVVFIRDYIYKKCIRDLNGFIDSNAIGKSKLIQNDLRNVRPFNLLSKKISSLLAQNKDQDSRYIKINQKFFDFANLTQEGWIMEDSVGFVYFCNPKFLEILEYDDESEIIGTRFANLLYDEQEVERYNSKYDQKFSTHLHRTKITFISKKGTKVECRQQMKQLKGDDGEVIGFCYTISDLSSFYSSNPEVSHLFEIRSASFEHNINPVVIIDADLNLVDCNTSFINYINKERASIITLPFKDTVEGFEIANHWDESLQNFEIFEPSLKKWYYIHHNLLLIDYKNYVIINFYDIDLYRKDYIYITYILEEIKGFFFITNKQDQVIYISPSFKRITQNTEEWFKNYYNLMKFSNPNQDRLSDMVINYKKLKYDFSLIEIKTEMENINLYQAFLK